MNIPTINYYLLRHEQMLRDCVNQTVIPSQRIKEAMLYALFPGGKRIRPALVYLTGEIVNVTPQCLDIIAAAVELTHCYSLIHDDLPAMDNDDFRRGKPSCHKAFDEATAILAGDGMQALGIELLLGRLPECLPSDKVVMVARELASASGPSGMVSGQSLDLIELSQTIDEQRLYEIHELKTGRLITACINMAIAAGEIAAKPSEALRQFANHLGLAFQMLDDYLDRYSHTDLLGKGRDSDRANQKTTFATLYCQETLFERVTQRFQKAIVALKHFKERANSLVQLTESIYQRINS